MSKAKEILAKKKAEAAAKKKKNAKVGELISKKNKVCVTYTPTSPFLHFPYKLGR